MCSTCVHQIPSTPELYSQPPSFQYLPNQKLDGTVSPSLNQQLSFSNDANFPASLLTETSMEPKDSSTFSIHSEESLFCSEGMSQEDSEEEVPNNDVQIQELEENFSYPLSYNPCTPMTPACLSHVMINTNSTPFNTWLSSPPNNISPLLTTPLHHHDPNIPPFLGGNHPNTSPFLGGVNCSPSSMFFPQGHQF